MASVELWKMLEHCKTLQAAIDDAIKIFALEIDCTKKQGLLKTVVEVYMLEQKHFQAVYMEAGSESDGEPGEENDSVEQVMRLEFDKAAEELGINQEVISKDGVFLEFDVNAVSAFVSAKAQVGYKKSVLKGMNQESSAEDKARIEAEFGYSERNSCQTSKGC